MDHRLRKFPRQPKEEFKRNIYAFEKSVEVVGDMIKKSGGPYLTGQYFTIGDQNCFIMLHIVFNYGMSDIK